MNIQELKSTIGVTFTPSSPIRTEALFAGRQRELASIQEAILEVGQHAVLYGERGVGKTSLANIASKHASTVSLVRCDSTDTFESIWLRAMESMNLELSNETGPKSLENVLKKAANTAASLAQFLIRNEIDGLLVVDEYDQVESPKDRAAMAHLLKHLSDAGHDLTVLLVGVANDIMDLVGDHPSVQRCIKQIQLKRMKAKELIEILFNGSKTLQMSFSKTALIFIVQSSQGFPYYTHLIAKHSCYAAASAGSLVVETTHLVDGMVEAITNSRVTIIERYEKAVAANRSNNFETVLFAAALSETTESGEFTPNDMAAPLEFAFGRACDPKTVQVNLTALCTDKKGVVLQRTGRKGAYKYMFSGPLMRAWVLLKGVERGVQLQDYIDSMNIQPTP